MYLFLDVDGTIINYKGETPLSARNGLLEAQKNGHLLIVCTGCSECEIKGRQIGVDFDGIIGGNGCYVKVKDQVLFHKPLTLQQCTHFVNWCKERNLAFRLECNEGMYISEDYLEKSYEARMKYVHGNTSGKKVSNIALPWMKTVEVYRCDVNKTAFVLNSYQDYLDAKEEFKDMIVDTWGGKDELALFGAVRSAGVDKKTSIRILMEQMLLSKKDCIAFGDGIVDLPMFEACGNSVAMGNANEIVKEHATYVTRDVDEDGLYQALCHFGLIGCE